MISQTVTTAASIFFCGLVAAQPTVVAAADGSLLYKNIASSIVVIHDRTSQGSGVAISEALVVTNCHVTTSNDVKVEVARKIYSAKVIHREPRYDLCICDVAGIKLRPVRAIRLVADIDVGETVFALGAPIGLALTLTKGIVSQKRRWESGGSVIQFDAAITPGNSGGGLFDEDGNLLGITTFVMLGKERTAQNLNFAYALDHLPERFRPRVISRQVSYSANEWRQRKSSVSKIVLLDYSRDWLKSQPASRDARHFLGRSLLLNVQYGESQILFEKLVRDDPLDRDSWYFLCWLYRVQNNEAGLTTCSSTAFQRWPELRTKINSLAL